MLSYNHLYDLVRRERSHQELQELQKEFYVETQQFLQGLLEAVRAEPLHSEAARTQFVNSQKLLKQLYELREEKILHLAQNKCRTGSSLIDTTKLLESERALFEDLITALTNARQCHHLDATQIIKPVEHQEPAPVMTISIKLLKPVPEFMGKSMETYGPFEENAIVELPEPVAQVLIRKGTAQPDI